MRNFFYVMSITTIFCLISACTGLGGAKVKDNYTRKVESHIDMNWQAAFRVLKDQTIECYQGGGGLSGTLIVHAQLYSELGEAEIRVDNGSWGTYLYMEVFKEDDATNVIGYSNLGMWDHNLDKLEPVTIDGKQTFDFDC